MLHPIDSRNRVTDPGARARAEHYVAVTQVDDLPGYTEAGDEQRGTAGDDRFVAESRRPLSPQP